MTDIKNIVKKLELITKKFAPTLIEQIIDEYGKNPYLILISCLLSLRARDKTTIYVCRSLFSLAKTPQDMLKISQSKLEKIIFRSGFYKNKAKAIHDVSRAIVNKFHGKVPKTYAELISIKGIGPKTANLVLGMAFEIPAICVDTHVHRISNLLGIVKTKTPTQTQLELEKIIDKKYWIKWNNLLVKLGQNVRLPKSPKDLKRVLLDYCKFSKDEQ